MSAIEVHRALDRARDLHHEDKDGAEAEAIRCHEIGRTIDDPALRGRALVLQAAISLQRGDLHGAVELISQAEPQARADAVRSELAAVKGQLNFFAGSYAESLAQAERAIELADDLGTLELRLFARRQACVVFGNIGVSDWHARLHEVLQLAIDAGSPWEEAMSRNDLAHYTMEQGDLEGAEAQIAVAMAIATPLAPLNRFALAVLGCTRSEVRLRAGHAVAALEDAQRSIELLTRAGDPNPYLLAMTVVVQVQALLALGRLDEAESSGQRAVARLGERVPQARSMILSTVAAALHEAGRDREAYRVLTQSVEVERAAFQELSALQRGLERATHETRAARDQSDVLAAKNRELEAVVHELGEARAALEQQADRDYLTGLHNRRYLARELSRHAAASDAGPYSLAVLDLDHFKQVNDRFGHEAGDQVLMRIASLLLGGVRGQDVVVRTGGEEFVLLMPQTDVISAAACCERVRQAIRNEPWDAIVPGLSLTVSAGVATAEDASDLQALAELADRRLYEAKRTGRDRVVV
jgi:diguanylate cyclase (GGDEF)-like protein